MLDRADLVELVMDAETDLGISLSEEETTRLATGTAADLWRIVVRTREGVEPPVDALPDPADPLWRHVRGWIALQLDVPSEGVTPERRLLA